MKTQNNIVDTDKVLSIIDRTLAELRTGIQPEKLTEKEKAGIIVELDKLEIQAWKCKVNVAIHSLAEEQPDISLRQALLHILHKVPDSLSPTGTSEIISHAKKRWEKHVSGLQTV